MPPKLPDAEQIARATPRPARQIVAFDGGQQGRALEGFGRAVGAAASEVSQGIDQRELAAARSHFVKERIRLESEIEGSTDEMSTLRDRFDSGIQDAMSASAGMISNARVRESFLQNATVDVERGVARVDTLARQRQADAGIASLTTLLEDNRSSALRAGPEDRQALINATNMAIQGALADGFITAVQAGTLRRDWANSFAKGSLEMMPPGERLAALQDGVFGDILQPDEIAVLERQSRKQVESAERQRQIEADKLLAERYAVSRSDLALAVDAGTATEDDIEAAFAGGEGWLKPTDRTALIKAARSKVEEIEDDVAIGDILRSGGALDPGNAKHREALDRAYVTEGGAQGLLSLENDAVIDLVDLTAQVGVMPERAETILRGFMNGGSSEQKLYAFDVVGRLQETAPSALERTFNARDISQASGYLRRVRSGVASETALAQIQEDMNPLNESARTLRRTEGRELAAEMDIGDVEDVVDPGLFFDTNAPEQRFLSDAMLADYRQNFEDFYAQHGNKDTAKELATAAMRRVYGRTGVMGDDVLMAYPPEKYYSVPGLDQSQNAEWMREQLAEDVREFTGISLPDQARTVGGAPMSGVEESAAEKLEGRILLVATPETVGDITAGRDPGYSVLLQDNNGVWHTVEDNGVAVTYRFDRSKPLADRNAELQAERDAFIDRQVDTFAPAPGPVMIPSGGF